jgi:SAM-dependent methyltransferase
MGYRGFAQRLWDESERLYQQRLLDAVPALAEGRMLDVGCDDGAWTDEVRRRAGLPAEAVSGIEIVESRRELATRRGFTVKAADIEGPWPFDDGEFALVHANQVIEHVKRLDPFVTEIHRVLAPGGQVLICTENLASWHNIGALVAGWQPFSVTNISSTGAVGNPMALHDEAHEFGETWQHIHVVTLRALVELFEVHGLVVEHQFAAGYYPLRGHLGSWAASKNPGHGHFIGIRARRVDG